MRKIFPFLVQFAAVLLFAGIAAAQYQPIPNFSGVAAGVSFRNAINQRFGGQVPISPEILTTTFGTLPAAQTGDILWCKDCTPGGTCAGNGPGSWAFAGNGIWTCLYPSSPTGDVTGSWGATTVTGLHFGAVGIPLGTAPIAGQLLGYNGSSIVGVTAAGSGTATSVGLALPPEFNVSNSPVTTSGTLTGAWNNQSPNLLLAGPTTGSAAAPTFRALVPADLSGAAVTSVGLSLPSSIFSVSGSPVTTTGTLAGSLATQPANYVLAGPTTGSAAAPTFRALVAADIPASGGSNMFFGTSLGNIQLTDGYAPLLAMKMTRAITIDNAYVGWPGVSCTTYPVIALEDVTTSVTYGSVTLTNANHSPSALTLIGTMPASGDVLEWVLSNAGFVSCSGSASANVSAMYH